MKGVGSLVGQPQLLILQLGETGNEKEMGGRGEGGGRERGGREKGKEERWREKGGREVGREKGKEESWEGGACRDFVACSRICTCKLPATNACMYLSLSQISCLLRSFSKCISSPFMSPNSASSSDTLGPCTKRRGVETCNKQDRNGRHKSGVKISQSLIPVWD